MDLPDGLSYFTLHRKMQKNPVTLLEEEEEEEEEIQSFTVGVIPIDNILCCDTVKDHQLMLQISMRNTHPHQ